jgi:serine/threonine protein kinase
VVQFLGLFTSDTKENYLVMEYLPKGSLLDTLHTEKEVLAPKDFIKM